VFFIIHRHKKITFFNYSKLTDFAEDLFKSGIRSPYLLTFLVDLYIETYQQALEGEVEEIRSGSFRAEIQEKTFTDTVNNKDSSDSESVQCYFGSFLAFSVTRLLSCIIINVPIGLICNFLMSNCSINFNTDLNSKISWFPNNKIVMACFLSIQLSKEEVINL
jgi:hypothetical protein